MISFQAIFIILLAHFVGDFILQTDAQAKGKSTSWLILLDHVGAYTTSVVAITVVGSLVFGLPVMVLGWWGIINGFLHFCVDAVTSRINSKLWAQGKIHLFFVCIGADQLLHTLCLLGTWIWILDTITN